MGVPATTEGDVDPFPYKMKDLCELTGLGRQAIHFYIQRGLLPPGKKTGRNMAWYSEEHVERLHLIKRLQHERFLPLKAIKAILDDQQSSFSEQQRSLLIGVKAHLSQGVTEAEGEVERVEEVLARHEVSREDFDRMVAAELIGTRREDGHEVIAKDDAWLLELWAEVDRLGFVRELGFTVDDLLLYDDVVTQLFVRETQLIASRLPDMDPERAAQLIDRVLPLVHRLVEGLHRAKIRNFLASID